LRVSFIGGGTDYLPFVETNGGLVLASSIDKYVYVNILKLPDFAREKYRFTYRVTESVDRIEDFKHPSLRESLIASNWNLPLNIATMADVPGSSGLGSSSSFVVALKLALNQYLGAESKSEDLAKFAISIERERLMEPGGLQDQYEASFGGMRIYRFGKNNCESQSLNLENSQLAEISRHFSLIFLPSERISDSHARDTATADRNILETMLNETKMIVEEICQAKTSSQIVEILHKAIRIDWSLKEQFSSSLTNASIAEAIKVCKNNGVKAIKLCGAGGGGFLLAGHEPEIRGRLTAVFPEGFVIPAVFTSQGAEVILK
jgi:D-glycero-alpha-D-manno-heptose-7-phosphate kinase